MHWIVFDLFFCCVTVKTIYYQPCHVKLTITHVAHVSAEQVYNLFSSSCYPVSHGLSTSLKSAGLQVCKSASLQVCKSASLQVCKSASLEVCESASLQVCKSASLQVCKSAVCKCRTPPSTTLSTPKRASENGFVRGTEREVFVSTISFVCLFSNSFGSLFAESCLRRESDLLT